MKDDVNASPLNTDKYALIAFDLDGTLVDSLPDLAHCTNLTLTALGLPVAPHEQFNVWIGDGMDQLILKALTHAQDVAPTLGDAQHSKAVETFRQIYSDKVCVHSKLYPNVVATLELLSKTGRTLAVITNKPRKFSVALLDTLEITHYFDCVICGDDLAEKKPHPTQLIHALDKYSLAPAQMLMVGDSKNDILSAQNAGCDQVFLTFGYHQGINPVDYHPHFIFDDFAQLGFLV